MLNIELRITKDLNFGIYLLDIHESDI